MQGAERRGAPRPTPVDPLPLYLYLRPLLRGARVLEAPGPASAATLRALGAAVPGASEGLEGPELLARARFALGKASIDWLLWNGDPEGLEDHWERICELLAPEGRLLVTLEAAGSEAARAARYRELVQALLRRFPAVQVLTRYGVRAEVVAPVGGNQELRVDATLAEAPAPAAVAYAFVCGAQPALLPPAQHLIPLSAVEAPEAAPPAAEGGWPLGAADPEAEGEPLEAGEEGGDERELNRLRRKLGDARERAELAELRADEAEQRLREAERRADRAEAERADLAVALRRLEHELEMAHRNNEALAATLAERKG